MRVRATAKGFYKGRRYPGDEFDIPDKAGNDKPVKLGKWMEKVEPEVKKPAAKKSAKADEGNDLSDLTE